ncbi:type VI secretion system-associated protein TagO, partial [Salmonella enterica]|uniref:type VI secretion system-associated protein TagO n=1 Tax=Salmonella enterica TaxID=28901 RepID=UPI001F37B366
GLIMTQRGGVRRTVIITTPAICNLPRRALLLFCCVDNINRMQVELTHAMKKDSIVVTLTADNRKFRSRWFFL